MRSLREDQSIRIADKGFPFLLKDLRTQVWTLLLLYLRSLQEEKANVHDVLSFLFRLSFLTVGEVPLPTQAPARCGTRARPVNNSPVAVPQGYQMDDLAFSESGLLQDLQDLGIIYRKHKCARLSWSCVCVCVCACVCGVCVCVCVVCVCVCVCR